MSNRSRFVTDKWVFSRAARIRTSKALGILDNAKHHVIYATGPTVADELTTIWALDLFKTLAGLVADEGDRAQAAAKAQHLAQESR